MSFLISVILFSIFFLLACIHAYWGLGGKWGADAAVPAHTTGHKVLNPRPMECFIVALGLLGCGLLMLVKAGLLTLNLPHWLDHYRL